MKQFRFTTILVALLLVAAACGQKDGVAGSGGGGLGVAAGGGGGFDDGGGGFGDAGDGGGFGDAGGGTDTGGSTGGDAGTGSAAGGGSTGGAATGGSSGGAAAGGGTTGGAAGGGGAATGGGTSGGAAAGGGGTPAAALGDRPGITVTAKKQIRIGIHAPVTGAAPVPQSTFEEARDDYWVWLKTAAGGVFGEYEVEVFFEDDEFNPNVAVQKCRKMVEQNDVFLLVGGGGADQITACATYANNAGVPYLSAGVNQDGLTGLRGYFALSQSYAQQSPAITAVTKGLGSKVAIGVSGSKSFQDAHKSIEKAYAAAGLTVVYNRNDLPKTITAGDALQIATDLRSSGAEVVYLLISPTSFITLAQAAQGQGYVPKYIGPGITSGLNTVATVGCPAIGEARFMSPFMGLDTVDQFDPNFKKNSDGGDDLALALWGLNESIHEMFKVAGKNMTRASFVGAVEGAGTLEFKVFNPLAITPQNHLGGQSMHLLKADCGSSSFKTQGTFGNFYRVATSHPRADRGSDATSQSPTRETDRMAITEGTDADEATDDESGADGGGARPRGADPTKVEGGSPNVVALDDEPRFTTGQLVAIGGGIALVVLLAIARPSQLLIGSITGFVYGLVALGIVLVFKSSGVFNFAQGEFGTVGVFAAWLAHTNGVPYLGAVLIGVGAAVIMGLLVERVIIRPLFNAPRVTLLVATAGVSLLAIGAEIWLGGANIRILDAALAEPQRVKLLGVFVSDQRLLIVAATILLGSALAYFFSRTSLGLAVIAASQEPVATELAGISVKRLSTLVWVLASLLGGLAGILFAPANGTFTPGLMTSQALIPGFTAAVIGGMTSLPGAFLGGAIVGVGQALGASGGVLPSSIPGGGAIATFVLLVTILSIRPQGILGDR